MRLLALAACSFVVVIIASDPSGTSIGEVETVPFN
jgi:hypothetical protein